MPLPPSRALKTRREMSTKPFFLEMSTRPLSPSQSPKTRDEHEATFSGDEHKTTFSLACSLPLVLSRQEMSVQPLSRLAWDVRTCRCPSKRPEHEEPRRRQSRKRLTRGLNRREVSSRSRNEARREWLEIRHAGEPPPARLLNPQHEPYRVVGSEMQTGSASSWGNGLVNYAVSPTVTLKADDTTHIRKRTRIHARRHTRSRTTRITYTHTRARNMRAVQREN